MPPLSQSNLNRIRTQSLHLSLIVDVLLKVQTSELSRNNHFPVGLIHLRFVTLVLYLESLWWSTVQLALLLHEQSDLALLLVELVDEQSAWLDQTSFSRAVFHSVVASLTLEVNVKISATPLHTVKESMSMHVSCKWWFWNFKWGLTHA
jgi:hypothetical protein